MERAEDDTSERTGLEGAQLGVAVLERMLYARTTLGIASWLFGRSENEAPQAS